MSNIQKIASFVEGDKVSQKIAKTLGTQKASMFQSSLITTLNSNEMLREATPESVYSSLLLATSLDLPINNNLGYAYIVPFKRKKGEQYVTEAQFQIGYKGIIQLAHRSNQFKSLNVSEIKECEVISFDYSTGKMEFNFEQDYDKRNSLNTIGFYAKFELLNGFEKSFYMSVKEIDKHKNKYSQTGRKGFGVWVDNYDEMAKKTVLKLLLLRYAPLSLEQQQALYSDQSVLNEDLEPAYVDNVQEPNFENLEVEKIEI